MSFPKWLLDGLSEEVLKKITEETLSQVQDLSEIQNKHLEKMTSDIIFEGKSILEATELQPENLEHVYNSAVLLYNSGKYEKSRKLLRHLMIANHKDPRFSFLIAACFHQEKKYEDAYYAYESAKLEDPKNPIIPFQQAHCAINLGHWEGAKECLREVINLGQSDPMFIEAVEKSKMTLSNLEKEHPSP